MMSVNAQEVVLSAVVDLANKKERQRAFSQANMEPATVRLWVLIYDLYHDIELTESAKDVCKANKDNKPVVEKWEPFVVALCAAIGNKKELQKEKNQQKISEFLNSYRFADGSKLPNVDCLESILILNMTKYELATFLKKRKERKESDAKRKREAQQLVQAAKAAKA